MVKNIFQDQECNQSIFFKPTLYKLTQVRKVGRIIYKMYVILKETEVGTL